MDRPTIQQVLEIAPELKDIRQEARRVLNRKAGLDFWQKYEYIKQQLNRVVGFFCVHDEYPDWMFTLEAHDTAYNYIFEGLT